MPDSWTGKYARRERERRFLATRLPDEPAPIRIAEITDIYLTGTRLRLRRTVERTALGQQVVHKLTQKVPDPDGTPGWITTVYLSEEEHRALAGVAGAVLRKSRYSIPPFGIDVFGPPLDGLVLAEIEFDSDEAMNDFPAPSWSVAEVTSDTRFTGGRLVGASRAELRTWLRTFEIDLP